MKLILILALAALFQACAPSQAEAIREERPVSIGYPAAAYRPNGKVAVGVGLDPTVGQEMKVKDTSSGGLALTGNNSDDVQDVKVRTEAVSPFVHYYPWATSAFFVGAGLEVARSRYNFEEDRTDGGTTNVSYETTGTYLGVPAGWAWIWDNGFSLFFDLGPRWRVREASRFNDSGEDENVNVSERDDMVDDLDELFANRVRFGGSSMIGFSF